ncbi:MAG TPA: class F sortase [Acidimicrobiales bacterium]|nr:class F sortase [Acidimicrobiales bacterium]
MAGRRSVTAAAALLLSLAGAACAAPAGDGDVVPAGPQAGPPTSTATTADVTPPDPEPDGTRSALADRVQPLGSARYDPAEHQAPTRLVTGLSLPSIDVVGAPVEAVGVAPDGEMEIPPADRVGWYRFGAAPGQPGSAVLAAHVAFDGVDGVFRRLDRLAPGDEVVVAFDDGSDERYRVTELVTFDKQALPDDLFSRHVPERLVLITCGGEFNPSLRSYESNVVAFAAPA